MACVLKANNQKNKTPKIFEYLVATADDMFMLFSLYLETLEDDYFHCWGILGLF